MVVHAESISTQLRHMEQPAVAVMVGVPGSGKSSVASLLAAQLEWPILSTDSIRAELTGSEADLSRDDVMWTTLYSRAESHIQHGESILVDATHNDHLRREFDTRYYRTLGAQSIIALVMKVPLDISLARNQQRERQVPPEVILGMAERLTRHPVTTGDGFDTVIPISNN